jgi:hypothetical protein
VHSILASKPSTRRDGQSPSVFDHQLPPAIGAVDDAVTALFAEERVWLLDDVLSAGLTSG